MLVLIGFFAFDPFGIIYNHNPIAERSGDVVGFENFDLNKMPYDAFIFGNSRTLAYKNKDWSPYIKSKNTFCFGAPGECVLNIYHKLKYIQKNGNTLKYVLLVLDEQIFNNHHNALKSLQGPVYLHHPKSSGKNYVDFYAAYLRFYFSDFFYLKFLDYRFTKVYKPYMKGAFNASNSMLPKVIHQSHYNLHNEENDSIAEWYLQHDYENYYKTHDFSSIIPQHPKHIDAEDIEMMKQMKQIFDTSQTELKVIIGPNYKNVKFPKYLVNEIQQIFGIPSVYDFSDFQFTPADSSLYLENSHYSALLGSKILDSIYRSPGR